MNVHVPQTRDNELTRAIDDLRFRWYPRGWPGGDDFGAADDDVSATRRARCHVNDGCVSNGNGLGRT
jgi:hypothetical protein